MDWELRTQSPLTGKLLSSAEAGTGLLGVGMSLWAFAEVCKANSSQSVVSLDFED